MGSNSCGVRASRDCQPVNQHQTTRSLLQIPVRLSDNLVLHPAIFARSIDGRRQKVERAEQALEADAATQPQYPGARGAGPQAADPPGGDGMQVRLLRFGAIEVDGSEYESDIVIESGRVGERKKKPSKPYRDQFGHTPLSIDEAIPWGGGRLIIGTGAYGSLPIMPEVLEEALRRGVDLTAIPTEDACRMIESLDRSEVNAILHVTC